MIDKHSNQNLSYNQRVSDKKNNIINQQHLQRSHDVQDQNSNNNNNTSTTPNHNTKLKQTHRSHHNGDSTQNGQPPPISPNNGTYTKPTHNYPLGPMKKLSRHELNPPTPSIMVQTESEVFSPQLQEFCLANPIVVIRNISRVLKLDLGLFSTKTLVEADSDHQIEIRTQLQQPSDQNWDVEKKKMIWRCESPRNFYKISKYALYQATTFQEFLSRSDEAKLKYQSNGFFNMNSNQNEHINNNNNLSSVYNNNNNDHCYNESTTLPSTKTPSASCSPNHTLSRDHSDSDSNSGSTTGHPSASPSSRIFRKLKKNAQFNVVTFGTNVDLSDTKKWKAQLDELDKLPMFSRVVSASNMLTHVGHSILGMNTVQLYMKVPGCRTPGHQENNNFCSVNINIGPGDCEWFGVPEEYWGPMAKLCAENNTNFVHGSWWPNLDDLYAYNIPVYRFIQKPGDLVWVNTGTVHWVQAIGWCNNIAWNVGPITSKQYRSAIERYEWNKAERYKSIVPMIHLTWNLARNVEIHDEEMYNIIKNFMATTLSYCERIISMLEASNIEVKWHGKAEHEAAHYCATCQIEVFNILFVKAIEKKLVVHCAKCAIEASQVLENFVVLQEYDINYLREIYSNFIQSFKSRRIRMKT